MWPNRPTLIESRAPPRSAAPTISPLPCPHATPQYAGPLHAYRRPIPLAPVYARMRQHQVEQRPVSLGENLLGLGGQSVKCMRLSEPRLDSSLLHETVAFQTEKMSANRVIGELKRGCKLIHALFTRPQLLKNSPPRAFQQSLSPTSVFHSETVRSAANQVKVVGAAAFPFLTQRPQRMISESPFSLSFAVRCLSFSALLFAFRLLLNDD